MLAISPFDFLPELISAMLFDLIMLPCLIFVSLKMIPEEVGGGAGAGEASGWHTLLHVFLLLQDGHQHLAAQRISQVLRHCLECWNVLACQNTPCSAPPTAASVGQGGLGLKGLQRNEQCPPQTRQVMEEARQRATRTSFPLSPIKEHWRLAAFICSVSPSSSASSARCLLPGSADLPPALPART